MFFLGRGAKEANLYSEIAEGIYSYGVTRHRHGEYVESYTVNGFYWHHLLKIIILWRPKLL